MKNEATNLNLAVISQDFLKKMETDLEEMKGLLKKKNEEEINSQWIESVDITKILGISKKTWQEYRNKRLIPFSQVGSKIYVKREDLENFMESHLIGTRRQA